MEPNLQNSQNNSSASNTNTKHKPMKKRGASLEKIRTNLSKVKNIFSHHPPPSAASGSANQVSIDYNPSPDSMSTQFDKLSVTTPPTDASDQNMDNEPSIFSPSHHNHHHSKPTKPSKPSIPQKPIPQQQIQSGYLPKPKLHPTIKQQQDKNAHNASLYAVNNNPTVQSRINVINQHQLQQQNKSNKYVANCIPFICTICCVFHEQITTPSINGCSSIFYKWQWSGTKESK